jgi:hypothetical protein
MTDTAEDGGVGLPAHGVDVGAGAIESALGDLLLPPEERGTPESGDTGRPRNARLHDGESLEEPRDPAVKKSTRNPEPDEGQGEADPYAFAPGDDPEPNPDEDGEVPAEGEGEGLSEDERGAAEGDETEISWDTRGGQSLKVSMRELKDGYMRDGDYRQKTQDLAARGQQLDESIGEVQQDYQRRFDAVDGVLAQITKFAIGKVESPDPGLLNSDPDRYYREKAGYDLREEAWGKIVADTEKVRGEVQEHKKRELAKFTTTERAKLPNLIPILRDPVRGAKVWAGMQEEFLHRGFSEEQRGNTISAANQLLIHDAMLWRLSQEAQSQQRGTKKKAPRLAKPGRGRSRGETSADRKRASQKRAAVTGSTEDAAVAFTDLLGI